MGRTGRYLKDQVQDDLGESDHREDVAEATHDPGEEPQEWIQEGGRGEEAGEVGRVFGPQAVSAPGKHCARTGEKRRAKSMKCAVSGSHVTEPKQRP